MSPPGAGGLFECRAWSGVLRGWPRGPLRCVGCSHAHCWGGFLLCRIIISGAACFLGATCGVCTPLLVEVWPYCARRCRPLFASWPVCYGAALHTVRVCRVCMRKKCLLAAFLPVLSVPKPVHTCHVPLS
jgi:hypothetical protein